MTPHNALEVMRVYNYSHLAGINGLNLQEFVRVNKEDVFAYFKLPYLYFLFSTRELNRPQRLFRQDLHNECLINCFDRKVTPFSQNFKKSTFDLRLLRLGLMTNFAAQNTSLSRRQPAPIPLQRTEQKTYFDSEFGAYFFVPVFFGEVNRFLEKFQVAGGYCGLSCSRLTKMKNLTKLNSPEEPCDIIALTKNPRQVEFESEIDEGNSSSLKKLIGSLWRDCVSSRMTKSVTKWKEKQKISHNLLMEKLPSKIQEWNYDSFMIADERMLLRLGYPEETAKKMHLLALFYKKVPIQPKL